MNVIMAQHRWKRIGRTCFRVVVQVQRTVSRFGNQRFKVFFISIKQERLLKRLGDFQILFVLFGGLRLELLDHVFYVYLELRRLLANNSINKKIFLIQRTHFIDSYVGSLVEIEPTYYLSIALLDAHVSHFP